MRRSAKIFLVILTIVLVLIAPRNAVLAKTTIPVATKEFYVNDFAKVFTVEEKKELLNNAVEFAKKTNGVQIVVTTVKSLEGANLEDYANEMYNQYKIGKNDMGLLILLSTGDRQIRVEVGRAMEGYINDAKAGRFMDKYAIPSLKQNKFNVGLIELQKAFITEISENLENVKNDTSKTSTETVTKIDLGVFILPVLFALIVCVVIFQIVSVIKSIKDNKKKLEEKILNQEQEKKRLSIIIQQYDSRNDKLKNEYNELREEYGRVQEAYLELQSRYDRAKTIYSDVDEKIEKMIEEEIEKADREKAKEFDFLASNLINLKPNKDLTSKLKHVMSLYESLNERQVTYVKTNLNDLKLLYSDSLKLQKEYEEKQREEKYKRKALEAENTIKSSILGISMGRARDYRTLKQAMNTYKGLEGGAQKYLNMALIMQLEELFRESKRDKEREEEIRNLYDSDSSSSDGFDSFGGFGGFGGSSGGGGASRGF